jgi:hypothetical protein
MTDLERFETTRETLATTAERANPAPERYDSALARYLAAVGNPRAHEPRHDNSLRHELYWNLENKPVSDVMAHAVVSVDEDGGLVSRCRLTPRKPRRPNAKAFASTGCARSPRSKGRS